PHCGELNEYTRPPTTAIVYCQHCRKPFGAAALSQTAPSMAAGGKTRSTSNPGGTPPAGVPRAPVSNEASPPGFAAPNPQPKKAIAAQVTVPKSRVDNRGDGAAKVIYRSPDGLETEFMLEEQNTIGRHPKNNIRLNDREISKEHAVIERQG